MIGAVGAIGGFLVPLAFAAPWVADPLSATQGAFTVFTAYYVVCARADLGALPAPPGAVRATGLAGAGI